MQVREPIETESEQIGRELLRQFYREEERLDPEFNQLDLSEEQDADRWIDEEGRGIFVAIDEGEMIGVVTVGQTESPPIYERGTIAFLEGLYVKPEFRELGIASALLERAEEWATNRQCEYIRTWVHVHNEKAIDLYDQSFLLKYQSFWKPLDK